jgi:hypothetical protein
MKKALTKPTLEANERFMLPQCGVARGIKQKIENTVAFSVLFG